MYKKHISITNILAIGYITLLVLPNYSCKHCSSINALPDLTYQYANVELSSNRFIMTTIVKNIALIADCVNPKNTSDETTQCISLLYKSPSDTTWQLVGSSTTPIKALNAGESTAIHYETAILQTGTYSVALEIDCEHIVAELDESNNKWTK